MIVAYALASFASLDYGRLSVIIDRSLGMMHRIEYREPIGRCGHSRCVLRPLSIGLHNRNCSMSPKIEELDVGHRSLRSPQTPATLGLVI